MPHHLSFDACSTQTSPAAIRVLPLNLVYSRLRVRCLIFEQNPPKLFLHLLNPNHPPPSLSHSVDSPSPSRAGAASLPACELPAETAEQESESGSAANSSAAALAEGAKEAGEGMLPLLRVARAAGGGGGEATSRGGSGIEAGSSLSQQQPGGGDGGKNNATR